MRNIQILIRSALLPLIEIKIIRFIDSIVSGPPSSNVFVFFVL